MKTGSAAQWKLSANQKMLMATSSPSERCRCVDATPEVPVTGVPAVISVAIRGAPFGRPADAPAICTLTRAFQASCRRFLRDELGASIACDDSTANMRELLGRTQAL